MESNPSSLCSKRKCRTEPGLDDMVDGPLQTGLIGGVEKCRIDIHAYDPSWPRKSETHASIIAHALGDAALTIEHIGSTSVPDLAAKPIVDILVVVQDSTNESS